MPDIDNDFQISRAQLNARVYTLYAYVYYNIHERERERSLSSTNERNVTWAAPQCGMPEKRERVARTRRAIS